MVKPHEKTTEINTNFDQYFPILSFEVANFYDRVDWGNITR